MTERTSNKDQPYSTSDACDRPLTKEFSPANLVAKVVTEPLLAQALTPAVERFARTGYGPQQVFGYHDWTHIEETRAAVQELVEECIAGGIPVQSTVLDHAALLHDIHSGVRYDFFGFSSAEQLSAHVAYNFLREQGATEEHARHVERIILATHYLFDPRSTEEIIMRAADLKNVGGPFDQFLKKSQQLHREHLAMSNQGESFEVFAVRSIRFLALYAWRYLTLRPGQKLGTHSRYWHRNAVRNLIELFALVRGGRQKIRVVVQLGLEMGLSRLPRTDEFLLGIDGDSVALELQVNALRMLALSKSTRSVALVVPGALSDLPLMDNSVDELVIAEALPFDVVCELAARVLSDGGEALFPNPGEGSGTDPHRVSQQYNLLELTPTQGRSGKLWRLRKI